MDCLAVAKKSDNSHARSIHSNTSIEYDYRTTGLEMIERRGVAMGQYRIKKGKMLEPTV